MKPSSTDTRAIVIGAGHNGLAAAFYLAKAGFRPLVLERHTAVGGGAATSTVHPGFKCPTLSHQASLWSDIVREMDLQRHGLERLIPPVEVFAPSPDGRALVVAADPRRTAESIRSFSDADAEAYPHYRDTLTRIAAVVAQLLSSPAPDLTSPGAADVWQLLKTGKRFRDLGSRDAYRLLRWGPMPVADMVAEWFESDPLRAAIAARGVSGTMLGPRSAGSTLVLLLREAHRLLSDGMTRVRGGPGALTAKMAAAATAAGAEIKTSMLVDRILTTGGRATGVLVHGQPIDAAFVVSAIDPKTTFTTLVDQAELPPGFRSRMRHYRASGTIAKINLALSGLPAFVVPPAWARKLPDLLSGRIHIGSRLDDLERAFDRVKYGEPPDAPWLDITIPTVLDPALAPQGGHVMSIYAHYAPRRLRGREWTPAVKDALKTTVLRVLEPYAPGLWRLVVGSQVLSPEDMEASCGFAGGHPFHGELALDQLFAMRPLLGYARYQSPIAGLYLCSGGTHPGGFMSGASGRLAAREIARIHS